ncbi:MAG: DegV family protein [Anaerolineae bacterium]|nr:DegV family protein [Anaerolineae bacterium]NUQ02731.1 DegV family protein [Anaerolineae bacterium]
MMAIKKIRFVTDSTCDIPAELAAKHHITVVPCYINYGSTSYADDGIAMSREQFYSELPNRRPHPSTAAMSPGQAEEMILNAAKDSDHLFIITVATKLSGVYNVMRLGARKLPEGSYTMIDSNSVTMGLGFQALIGSEVAEATGDVEQVERAVMQVQRNQRVYAALDTLEYLRRGGRVGWTTASIGSLLQIKPIIGVKDGEVYSVTRVRTFSRAIDEMIAQLDKHTPLDRISVMYATETDLVRQLTERLAQLVPNKILITQITPTIGVHIGPTGIGVTVLSSAWRT